MPQFFTATEIKGKRKAACLSCGLWDMLGEPRICDSCEFPSSLSAGFPHHLVDFELWLRNSCEGLDNYPDGSSEFGDSCITALALIDLFRASESAINFGDDVNTAPTSPTVPVGNTGTTSTGRVS